MSRISLGDMPIVNMNGKGADRLQKVLELVPGFPAHGYAVQMRDGQPERMVLFQYIDPPKAATRFPAPLGPAECVPMIMAWLENAQYTREPDHDGDNAEGWRCYNDGWGQIDGFGYHSFIAIETHWLMYGK